MPLLLFSLRGVPDDEAEEVRELLTSNSIDFYETSAGPWGTSTPALWLRDEEQFTRARSLIEEYEKERSARERTQYAQLDREGKRRTVTDIIREDPLRFVLYMAIIAAVLYFSIKPFLTIGR